MFFLIVPPELLYFANVLVVKYPMGFFNPFCPRQPFGKKGSGPNVLPKGFVQEGLKSLLSIDNQTFAMSNLKEFGDNKISG
jgi:hypothetical protein